MQLQNLCDAADQLQCEELQPLQMIQEYVMIIMLSCSFSLGGVPLEFQCCEPCFMLLFWGAHWNSTLPIYHSQRVDASGAFLLGLAVGWEKSSMKSLTQEQTGIDWYLVLGWCQRLFKDVWDARWFKPNSTHSHKVRTIVQKHATINDTFRTECANVCMQMWANWKVVIALGSAHLLICCCYQCCGARTHPSGCRCPCSSSTIR